ncbi:MAG: ParA family protein [Elusimicrobia bacterium]|nr:ParA family protein [Elusimicrobiota bacterium]
MKAEVISIANQKGGVGKTTSAISLAAALAHNGKDTLLIDMDPQGNASSGLGFDKKTMEENIYPVLMGTLPIEKAVRNTKVDYLDMICANGHLIGAEIELVSAIAREMRLKQVIDRVSEAYQFIIIDCPPSLGLLTLNALAATNKVIIPIQSEYYALEGLASFMDTIGKIRMALNPGLSVEGVLLTMFDTRIALGHQVKAEIEKHFQGMTFKTAIPRNIRLAEAPGFGQSIIQYDQRSRGAEAYLALAAEILERRGHQPPEMKVSDEQEVEHELVEAAEKKP